MITDKRTIEADAGLPTLEGGATRELVAQHQRREQGREPRSYYDIPMLKPSLWKWEIASYFFLGGVSAGSFLLSRVAARFGRGKYPAVTRAGTAVAAAAFLPCAPLLIKDLGDPKRFLFMLRVFKPKSPMNLGAWILTGFGGALSMTALIEWFRERRRGKAGAAAAAADTALGVALDAAGIPLALGLATYTGVLLSTTSTPIWARNRWLGPLFSAGALSTGASAISLALNAAQADEREIEPVKKVTLVAKAAEAVALGGFLAEAGSLAKPVLTGKYAPHLIGGAIGAGLVLSTLLETAPARSSSARRSLHIAGALAGLAGGYLLRWSLVQAGHPSGGDPEAARKSSGS